MHIRAHRRPRRALLSVMLASLVLAGCSGGEAETAGSTADDASNPDASGTESGASESPDAAPAGDGEAVHLALINPVSGTAAEYGQDMLAGQKCAIKMTNEAGGVLGSQITTSEFDDQNLPEVAVSIAQRVITQDGVKFIVGTNGSNVALAVRNVTEDAEVLYVIGTSKGPTVTDEEFDYLVRLNSEPGMDSEFLYPYIDDVAAPERVAILEETSDYGQFLAETTREYFGDRVVANVVTELDTTNFGPFVNEIESAEPDAIFMANGGSTSAAAASIQQIRERGIDATIILPPGTVNAELIELTGEDAIEGAVSADVYTPTLDNEENEAFLECYEAEYGTAPSVQAELGYEQILVLVEGMEAAGTTTDPTAVREAMGETEFETPRGTITIDETGQAIPQSGLIPLVITDGEVQVNTEYQESQG